MRKLRVWVVTPELHRSGGTERSVAEQVDRWRHRFDLRLYTMRTQDVDLSGIELRRIPRLPGPHLLRFLWWVTANHVVRWWDARSAGPPDVVFSPGINCIDADAIAVHMIFTRHWRRARSSVLRELTRPRSAVRVLHQHAFWLVVGVLERLLYPRPITLWALAGADARQLERGFGRAEQSVPSIPHGVDISNFSVHRRKRHRKAARARLGVSSQQRVCLLVANDAYTKGVDIAVDAIADLPEAALLAIAGKVNAAQVESWARERGVRERVLLGPHVPDVMDYYAAADVLIAPSREDTFNMPVLEAMACGIPVVVSTRAGVAELIEDGRQALLMSDAADAGELAHLIRRVLSDPPLADRLSVGGRALAETLSWEANARVTGDLIEQDATKARVLVLAPDPSGVGGIERVNATLLKALTDIYGPNRVGVLSLWSRPKSPGEWRHIYLGSPVSKDPPGRVGLSQRIGFTIAALRAVASWKDQRLCLIAGHPSLAPVAWLAGAGTRTPYAVWCHGEEVWGPLPRLVRMALRRADLVFAPSQFTASTVESTAQLPRGSVEVVPHGLTHDFAIPIARRRYPPRVLTVARLDPEHHYKGVDTLLSAWPKVIARVPEAALEVVGDGPDRPRLERLAKSLCLGDSVSFAGRVSDDELRRAYAQAGVFALPGRHSMGPRPEGEGFGVVFIEAGAASLPVVAGRGGGTTQAVCHEQNGLLVDSGNLDEVADAIIRLLTSPGLASRLGKNGQLRALNEFSYSTFRQSIAGLVEDKLIKVN